MKHLRWKAWSEKGTFLMSSWGGNACLSRGGSLHSWQECGLGSTGPQIEGKAPCTCPAIKHLWGPQQVVSQFHPLGGSSLRGKRKKKWLLSPPGQDRAKPSISLDDRNTAKACHYSEHSYTAKLPNTLIIMFSKVSVVYEQFSETSYCRPAGSTPDTLSQKFRGCVLGIQV